MKYLNNLIFIILLILLFQFAFILMLMKIQSIFFTLTAVMNHVLLELMEASVNQLVNAKMEGLVIQCQGNATAQKDGR